MDPKEKLEIEKLQLEVNELKRRFLKRIAAFSPLIIVLLTFIAGIWTGFFDRKRAELENQSKFLKSKNDSLSISLQNKQDSLVLYTKNVNIQREKLFSLQLELKDLSDSYVKEKVIRLENIFKSDELKYGFLNNVYKKYFIDKKSQFYKTLTQNNTFIEFLNSTQVKVNILNDLNDSTFKGLKRKERLEKIFGKFDNENVELIDELNGNMILFSKDKIMVTSSYMNKLENYFKEFKKAIN